MSVTPVMTGGCQCGAVRYALNSQPEGGFCHCRMCQRATGGPFAAYATVKRSAFSWTQGEPSYFASSSVGMASAIISESALVVASDEPQLGQKQRIVPGEDS